MLNSYRMDWKWKLVKGDRNGNNGQTQKLWARTAGQAVEGYGLWQERQMCAGQARKDDVTQHVGKPFLLSHYSCH